MQARRDALAKLIQLTGVDKQKLQRISDIKTRIAAFAGQMGEFYSELEPVLRSVGVTEVDLKAYRPQYAGNTNAPLDARAIEIQRAIDDREGGEPPNAETIRWFQQQIGVLQAKESADKARQERTKQIQTRIAAINAEIERINAEIAQIEGPERERIKQLQGMRLDAYVAYFVNLKEEQKTLEGLYEPIRKKLNEEALLDDSPLEFSIRWEADLKAWLERGGALLDQRRVIPYGTFDKLGHAWRTAPKKAAASSATATERRSASHLLPSADQGAMTKPGRKWCLETRDTVTAAIGIAAHTCQRVRCGLPVPARMTSGDRHAPAMSRPTNDLVTSRSQGMVADIGIHRPDASDGEEQPHAHVLLTMRRLDPSSQTGFSAKKERDWNEREDIARAVADARKRFNNTGLLEDKLALEAVEAQRNVNIWRAGWAEYANRALREVGADARIDHRTLEAQGIFRAPQPNIGLARHIEKAYVYLKDRLTQWVAVKKRTLIYREVEQYRRRDPVKVAEFVLRLSDMAEDIAAHYRHQNPNPIPEVPLER